MAIPIPGTTPRDVGGGRTGLDTVGDFIRIRLEGQEELIAALLRAATRAGRDATKPLNDACRAAMKPIMETYKNSIPVVTGNLRRSVQIRGTRGRKIPGVGVAIGGPTHAKSGKEWDVEVKGAGNHAWLKEFGTGRRKPGTQGRRTLVNVHQKINGRYRRVGDGTQWVRNDDFDKLGAGNYFIMSSYNEPTRKAGRGKGYPHDFVMALESGGTYGAMPASNSMQNAIRSSSTPALNTLIAALKQQIESIQRAA